MKTVQLAKQVRALALSLGIILSGLAVFEPAEAAPIQVSFTGIVLGSNLALSPPFEALSASNDDNGTANIARYNHPITGLSVTVGTGPSYVTTTGAFNSNYPTTAPSISAFTTTNRWPLVYAAGGQGGGQGVQGALTSLPAVPLPAAVILFGGGLIALVGLGAGSWSRKLEAEDRHMGVGRTI